MSDNRDSDEESYSYSSSKIVYRRSRSRPSSVASTEVYVSTELDDASKYLPVTRWAVDYNNRNYIRSLCNKNRGQHRALKGRSPKFNIHYDNNYFTRSKVNAPKGLHRKIAEIIRKYVPDDDELADATGWEFEYGPEFDQVEQDVHYIPEGRIIRRGCYRWYGVKRNDSDCDIKVKEERENLLNEELEQQLKYGHEFLQSDIPYLEEQKKKRYIRGSYRSYEVPRNLHDFKPEELDEIPRNAEWRFKHHSNDFRYLDLEMCQCDKDDVSERCHHTKKGKPFRRTVLNKVYELKKEDSSKDVKRFATRLSLVPGEGRQSLYEGIPDRQRYGTKESDSARSVYKKKTEKFISSGKGGEYEEYETENTEKSYTEVRPAYEERQHKKAQVRNGKRLSDEDFTRKEKESRRFDDYTYKVKPGNTLYEKEKDKKVLRTAERKPSEKFIEKRDYPLKDDTDDRKRKKEKFYDHEERKIEEHSQREMKHSQDRRHGNQIYKQAEDTKIKGKTGDRSNIKIQLPHIRDRGEIPGDTTNFEAKLTSGTEKLSKKMPPHVDERVKNIRGRMERNMESADRKDKDEALRKMPPHVEERIKNFRERMERKMDSSGGRQKGRRGGDEAFDHSSSDEGIDLLKHKSHPKDRGETHNAGYEKYITKNGSEMWVKKNEKYAELHHKNHR